jgi:hypothetical protein
VTRLCTGEERRASPHRQEVAHLTRCTRTRTRIEDALENITHSLCTLEFEDQRIFYDWVIEKIASFGLCNGRCLSRLNSRG